MSRELRVDGVLQPLSTKVFDALLLLLRERHRVVTKRELCAVVWQDQTISDAVVARTVMQARRAIGDSAARPEWIKTVHGFGYRFCGPVVESATHAPVVAAVAAFDTKPEATLARRRIAVLPCEDHTGDVTLDWLPVGLMTLVGHALEADARLDVVSPCAASAALGTLGVCAAANDVVVVAEADAHRLRCELGLQYTVQAAVHCDAAGLNAHYRVSGADSFVRAGSVHAGDAIALADALAQAVAAVLSPGSSARPCLESTDAFANEALGRAVAHHARGQWRLAAGMLAVVCDAEPGSRVARRWWSQVLAAGQAAPPLPLGA